MSLVQRYLAFITQNHLFNKSDHLLIAVSGGADSVVLCELCHQAGYTFSIAHCNFRLRGEESNRDEAFVRSLAEKYNVPLYVKMVDTTTIAKELKLSIQETARKVRYDWFYEILQGKETSSANQKTPVKPGYILTAHHLDDSIETMLMNFFKGTGITGLKGIRAKQHKLVRPLLFANKDEIIEFARSAKLTWVEDSSNLEEKYTRNYFRNTIIPSVEKVFPSVRSNLAENLHRFGDIQKLYAQAIQVHKSKLIELRSGVIHISVLKLKKSDPLDTIIFEIIKDYGFSSQQVKEVKKLLNADTGSYITSATYRILRNRVWLVISPLQSDEQS
ncbi:MAG TPA: tRNA lysidine(34) synthetase TilS, partial [Chitinophagaceae bacterium]